MHDTYQAEAWFRSLLTQWREVAPMPRMDVVVACEAKASWFDPTTRKWKTTHSGGARRICDQLEVLLNHTGSTASLFCIWAPPSPV